MTGWDRMAPGYLAEWLPQFSPYDADFAAELGLRAGDRVLTTAGAEVLALARAVGEGGIVHAVDASDEVRVLCKERVLAAGLAAQIEVSEARADQPYDAAASAFELELADDPAAHLRSLRDAITKTGKIAVMLWGPLAEDDPERLFARSIDEVEPSIHATGRGKCPVERAALGALLESAGLVVVRHTVIAHTLVFQRAERFASCLLAARTYGSRLVALGEPRVAAVLARFYERVGRQDAPISYSPAATIVIAALPGAEVELPHRPSVRVPLP